ncbi:MAG: hypothetical protein HFG15_00045 [Bacilli bacterium]|nr:hypothetical protein [Bacilli bacterium]
MKKFFTKCLVHILITGILLNALPVTVFAEALSMTKIAPPIDLTSERWPSPTITKELVERRTENQKYFLMSDNSITVATYPEMVHQEVNGAFTEINNTMVSDGDDYKLKNNRLDYKFSKKASEQKILTVTTHGQQINWGLVGAKNVKSELSNPDFRLKSLSKEEQKLSIDHLTNQVRYSQILPEIDLVYDVTPASIKENIILKSKKALEQQLVFSLRVKKSNYEQPDPRTIVFKDQKTNQEIYRITAPYLYDANLEYSDALTLKIAEEHNRYLVTLDLPEDWLRDPKRAYPVTIDPSIITSQDYNKIADTYIYPEDANNHTKGAAHVIRVGNNHLGNGGSFRGLVKFTLPELSSGDQIIDADFRIYHYPDTDEWNPPTGTYQIDVHKMTSDWAEMNAHWSSLHDKYDPKVVDYMQYHYSDNDPCHENQLNITEIVKDWYTTGNNYGLMLKEHVEKKDNTRQDMMFLSSDTNASAWYYGRPVAVITYRNQTGLEDYLTYHTSAKGRAGTVYTNDYNGNLVMVHEDAATSGTRLPVSINHIYNTNDANTNIGYGHGFRLNLNQTIELKTIEKIEYAKYIDEDGTIHYFYKEGSRYLDEDGLSLTLKMNGTNFEMQDKEGNKRIFEKNGTSWRLKEIWDTNQNKITITYTGNDITKVADATGETITLMYENQLLTKITDAAGRVQQYHYTNQDLTKITYPDGEETYYQYHSNHYLKEIKDIDASRLIYDYYPAKPYRIKTIQEFDTKGEVGKQLTIQYGNNATYFKDHEGYETHYTFNDLGHTISIGDLGIDGGSTFDQVYGKTYTYGTTGGSKNKVTKDQQLMGTINNYVLNGSFEDGESNWQKQDLEEASITAKLDSDSPYYGVKALKLSSANNKINSRYYQTNTKVTPGESYTFSAYLKMEEIATSDGQVSLYIAYTDATGKEVVKKSAGITKNQDYMRSSVTIDLPEGSSQTIQTGIMIENTKGNIFMDAAQLELGKTANFYNLVENNAFLHGNTYWTPVETTSGDGVKLEQQNSVFYMSGDSSKKKRNVQTIPIRGKKGDQFHLSYWTKTGAVRDSEISVGVLGTDNQIQWLGLHANHDSDDWQYVSNTFTVDRDYQSITLYLCYYNEANHVLFDNITLLKDVRSDDYEYDQKGNLITSKKIDQNTEKAFYSANDKLIKSMNLKGTNYEYEYDFQHKNRLTKAVNKNLDLDYQFTYDQYGNNTGIKVDSNRSNVAIKEKAYYVKSTHSGKVLEVEDGRVVDNTRIREFTFNQGAHQQLLFTKVDDHYYKISTNRMTDKYFSINDEGNIVIQSYNNLDTQKWKIEEGTDHTIQLISKTGKAMTLDTNEHYFKASDNTRASTQYMRLYEIAENKIHSDTVLEDNEVYRIKSKSSNLYLAIKGIGSNTDAVTQVKLDENDVDQYFRLVKKNDGYAILPLKYAKNVGIFPKKSSGGSYNQAPIQAYTNRDSYFDQHWRITEASDGDGYMIATMTNYQNIQVLTNEEKKENLALRNRTEDNNQRFYFEKLNLNNLQNGTYHIKNFNSNLYIGTIHNATSNGSTIEQQNKIGGHTQQWVITNLYNGYYKISQKESKKVLTVRNGSIENDTPIQLEDEKNITSNRSQQWEIVPKQNGTYTIRSRVADGQSSFDVYGASKDANTRITLHQGNGTVAQDFVFELLDASSMDYMESKATYSRDGKFLTKETDTLDHSIEYEYHYNDTEKTGTLKSVKDAKGTKTNYEYDVLDRTTKIASGEYQNQYTYQYDKLNTIAHNGFQYQFDYDTFGNMKQVRVADKTLVTNEYASRNGRLTSVLYGNQQKINYEYDQFGRTTKKTMQDNIYQYEYDARGNVASILDKNAKEDYTYDMSSRLISSNHTSGFKRNYQYDSNSNVSKTNYQLTSQDHTTQYQYDRDSRIRHMKSEDSLITYDYDTLSRLAEKTLSTNNKKQTTTYTYLTKGSKTSTVISRVKVGSDTYDYTYDVNGNIETIKKNNALQVKYYYDAMNQLVKEDHHLLNQTIAYEYDHGGNLQAKKQYKLGTTESVSNVTYTYDATWKDLLTSYNGKAITYDEIGNPTSYDGSTYAWKNGRQLSQVTKGDQTISYQYNEAGIRTEKKVGEVTTKYHVEGNNIIYEQTGDDIIYYNYDNANEVTSMNYKNKTYYYQKNIQNDIIGLLDENLELIVQYAYDGWGNLISIKDRDGNEITDPSHVGVINPYRYRSYRYDHETGLYYLQSRYYNSQWGRFINADGIVGANEDILGYNLFAYCSNNPVNRIDTDGTFAGAITAALGLTITGKMVLNAIVGGAIMSIVGTGAAAIVYDLATNMKPYQWPKKSKDNKKNDNKTHAVYVLVKDHNLGLNKKNVVYVGRTNSIKRRSQEHNRSLRKGLTMVVIKDNLTFPEARGLEQVTIMTYNTLKKEDKRYNQINGIAEKNPNYNTYIAIGNSLLADSLTYVGG